MKVIDIRNFDIPSDENDYDELVAFADTIANAHEFEAVPLEVLDKIKAEIAQEIILRNSDQYDDEVKWYNMGLRKALQVIDKNKTESEDK